MALYEENRTRRNGLLAGGWTNVVIGLIIAAIPFFALEATTAFWNNVVIGLLAAILAGYTAYMASRGMGVAWAPVVNVLLGLWIVVSPFLFAMDTLMFWANIVLGLILAAVAAYNAYAGAATTRRGGVAGRPGI